MEHDKLIETRRTLHGIAELLIAGPQYRTHGTIRMRVSPGGFRGIAMDVRVDGTEVLYEGTSHPIAGTARELAAALGLDVGRPADLYHDTSGVGPDDRLIVDARAAATIAAWFATGETALRTAFADAEPVLWPEHFDLAVAVDEVTYGVSSGDSTHPGPYAYVAPFERRSGDFWNAPFGAILPAQEVDELIAFFGAGRSAAALGCVSEPTDDRPTR